jgi:hypothetical protein
MRRSRRGKKGTGGGEEEEETKMITDQEFLRMF